MGNERALANSKNNAKLICNGNLRDKSTAFTKFRETLEREIESAVLEKMKTFRDELLRSRLK